MKKGLRRLPSPRSDEIRQRRRPLRALPQHRPGLRGIEWWKSIGCTTRRASSAAISSARARAPRPAWSPRPAPACPARLSARYSTTVLVSGQTSARPRWPRAWAPPVPTTPPADATSPRPGPSIRRPRQGHASHSTREPAPPTRQEWRELRRGAEPGREAARSASRNGRSGTSAAVGLHLPTKTVPPAALAQLVSSLARRLLPIPALRGSRASAARRHARCSSETRVASDHDRAERAGALEVRTSCPTTSHGT